MGGYFFFSGSSIRAIRQNSEAPPVPRSLASNELNIGKPSIVTPLPLETLGKRESSDAANPESVKKHLTAQASLKLNLSQEKNNDFNANQSPESLNNKLTPLPATEATHSEPPSPPRSYKYFVGLGFGADFLTFSQSGTETKALEFSSLLGSSYTFQGGVKPSAGLGVEISSSRFPGKVHANNIDVTNSSYTWTVNNLEATYQVPVTWFYQEMGQFATRLGVQLHQLPYVEVLSFSSAEIKRYDLTMASLGGEYTFLVGNWKPQILLRYHFPFSQNNVGTNNFELAPQVNFDGSIGTHYFLSGGFQWGVFWYGQLQEYKYKMRSQTTGLEDSGKSRYFFSNIEFRLGVQF
jgi:hypothetical protein